MNYIDIINNSRGWARKGAEGFLTVVHNPVFDMDTQQEDYRYSIPSLLGREIVSKQAAPVVDDLDARYDRLQQRTSRTSSSITSNNFTQALAQAYRNIGIKDENLIKILVGKDALETGWGKSVIGQNNFGNITTGSDWTGQYVEHHNRRNGQTYKFRSYSSPDEYARDSWRLLSNRYGIKEGDTIEVVRQKLNKGGYAEEGYGDGFSRICRQIGAV